MSAEGGAVCAEPATVHWSVSSTGGTNPARNTVTWTVLDTTNPARKEG